MGFNHLCEKWFNNIEIQLVEYKSVDIVAVGVE